MRHYIYFLLLPLTLFACQQVEERADAYGNFEATVTTVSAEANGRLLFLKVEEGQKMTAGILIGQVDTTALHLQRLQLQATIGTLPKKLRTAEPDIQVLEDQKRNLIRERDRLQKLVAAKAATSKQLDDLNGEIVVVEQRIQAARSQAQTVNRGILAEKAPLKAQIEVIKEQIRKAKIYNPINGTVLTKLAESSEVVAMGTPLYRIAVLDTLILRAYTDAVLLQDIHIGKEVAVLVDSGADNYQSLQGKVTWIAEEAEFTPKTIQTKEDRVNLVYAFKIEVPNPDGLLKIGMPAEVNFKEKENKISEK